MKKKAKDVNFEKILSEIRSELTHMQEISFIYPLLSQNDVKQVKKSLKHLEEMQKSSKESS